jgi:hypothetical protein
VVVAVAEVVGLLAADVDRELQSVGVTGQAQVDVVPAARGRDGIAEAWWDSPEDMNAGFSGPEGSVASQKLIDDEAQFLDFDHCVAFLTEEKTIIELDEAATATA